MKSCTLFIRSESIGCVILVCGLNGVGKSTMAKALAEFDIELEEIENSTIKIPAHSCVAIRATMKEYLEVGDHYLYICDVEQVYGDTTEEALFSWNGYSQIAPAHQ